MKGLGLGFRVSGRARFIKELYYLGFYNASVRGSMRVVQGGSLRVLLWFYDLSGDLVE